MRTLSLAALLFLGSVLASGQNLQDLSVMREDGTSLTLDYHPNIERSSSGEGGVIQYTIPFGLTTRRDSIVDLRQYRTFPVVLPTKSAFLRIVQSDFVDTLDPSANLHAVWSPLPDFGAVLRPLRSPGGETPEIDPPAASLDGVVADGQYFRGAITFHPVHLLGGGRVRLYRRIVVQLTHDLIPAGSPPASRFMRVSTPDVIRRSALAKRTASDSPLAQGDWYRFDVTDDGAYKIDLAYLKSSGVILPSSPDIRSIRIFGNGGRALPENLNAPRLPDLTEVPRMIVDRNGNGIMDSDDYIVVFCRSTRGWRYDPTYRTFRHFIHPYTERNSYFIAVGLSGSGVEMDSLTSPDPATGIETTSFQGKIFLEQERTNIGMTGRRWVGQSFNLLSPGATYSNLLPGLVASSPIFYRFDVLSRSATVDTFTVTENGVPLLGSFLMGVTDVTFGNNTGYCASDRLVDGVTREGALPGDRSILKFRFGTRNQDALGWLDWFDILYRRKFEAVNDYLQFESPDTTCLSSYTIRNLSSRDVVAFDVSDHQNIHRITNLTFDPADVTVCKFALPSTAGSVREMVVVGANGFRTPPAATRIRNSNLHGVTQPVDFVIIAPTEFLDDAIRLKNHREAHDSLRTYVAELSAIYNEFSGGLQDVMAIRDFLRYARVSWQLSPKYVLLLGNGHYDYKNITTSVPEWIPVYETAESIYQDYSYPSDDFFAFLNPADQSRVSMGIGRLPARTRTDATTMVDKIIAYDTQSPFDPWRDRVTFVADDDLTSGGGSDGTLHTDQADFLATYRTPDFIDKRKIYLFEFPTVNSAAGRRKPGVNEAIVDAVNRGTLILNYTGHGNENLWAHEYVFTREGDIPRLVNKDRLTFVLTATCSFALYDRPDEQSAGELLMTMPGGGAVGEIGSARAVYSTNNAQFNYLIYAYQFQRGADSTYPRLGDVVYSTKQSFNDLNSRKFILFSDPTLRLSIPGLRAVVDSVNGSPTTTMNSVQSLGVVRVDGSLRNAGGGVDATFNGNAVVQMFDAKRIVPIPQYGTSFSQTGSLLYQGNVTVKDGRFRALLPVPKDVSYGAQSRISLYLSNGSVDGAGYTENIQVNGIDSTAVPDSTGPTVDVYLNDTNFRSGDITPPDPTLIVRLSDVSGINTSTVGIGHRLEARMTNPDGTIDLSSYYRADLDTYKSGEIQYPFRNLSEGRHQLSVKAWDVQNNSTETTIAFEVRSTSDLSIVHPLNFPNPFRRSTVFTFQRSSTDPVSVSIRIYTVAGRLVKKLDAENVTDRFVEVPWDGRDADGDEVANGIYFYRLTVRTADGRSVETIEKLVVVR